MTEDVQQHSVFWSLKRSHDMFLSNQRALPLVDEETESLRKKIKTQTLCNKMEEIYPPESFKATDHIDLQTHFEEFAQSVKGSAHQLEPTEKEAISEILGLQLDQKMFEELTASTSDDRLTCQGEESRESVAEVTPDYKFKLTSYFSEQLTQELQTVLCKANQSRTLHAAQTEATTWSKLCNRVVGFPEATVGAEPDLIPNSNFVVIVAVYKPFHMSYECKERRNNSRSLRWSHEITLLGSNTLADLRDKMYCASDAGLCVEVENTSVDLSQLDYAKETYPSGFLYIDDVFYNDFRSPTAIDYSSPIYKWATDKIGGQFQTGDMTGVTISELKPRFGYPYVYMHQGDCEHIFTFIDACLLSEKHCLHSYFYPHVSTILNASSRMCFICGLTCGKWLVIDSDRLPQDKNLLCTNCCNSYMYKDGEKVGEFKLYPFYTWDHV